MFLSNVFKLMRHTIKQQGGDSFWVPAKKNMLYVKKKSVFIQVDSAPEYWGNSIRVETTIWVNVLSILNAAYIHLSAGHNLRNFAICMYFRYRYVFFFFFKWTRHPPGNSWGYKFSCYTNRVARGHFWKNFYMYIRIVYSECGVSLFMLMILFDKLYGLCMH